MLELKKLIENIVHESLSDNNITKIIKQTAKEFQEDNNCSLWDINNGLCADFSGVVIEKMGGSNENLFELSGDMFFSVIDSDFAKENWSDIMETKYGVWSLKMLKHWGTPLNVDLTKVDDDIAHVWIYFNGKHYDAEAPNGVDKWFEIPLIKKFFKRYENL